MPRIGRPREFDEDEVLGKARDLFWARGYRATSVQDLVDELGIERGSLYAAFGDKHSLYLRAVELYWTRNREQLETLVATDPVLPALYRMITLPATATAVASKRKTRGCLVGNTTAELVPGDPEAEALVAGAFEGFVEVVADALGRGQANGEISTTATPEAQARLLLILFQGTALVARASRGRQRLIEGVDIVFDALRTREARQGR